MAEEIGTTAPWSHQTVPTQTNLRDIFILPAEGCNEHNTALAKVIQIEQSEKSWPVEVDGSLHIVELMHAPMFYLLVHELNGGIPDAKIADFAARLYMAGKVSEGWLDRLGEQGDSVTPM